MKNKFGKTVEVLSDTMTNTQKRHAIAVKMIMDPEFWLEQGELFSLYKILNLMIDDVYNQLQEGFFCLKMNKKLNNLYQNAATAHRRLIDEILKDSDFNHNKEENEAIYEDASRVAYGMTDFMRYVINYTTQEKDRWRQEELNRFINELIPESAIKSRIEEAEQYLAEKYKQERIEILAKATKE